MVLSRIITGVKIFYHYSENFLSQAWKNFFIGLKILFCLSVFSVRFVEFFAYPRIFHHVSMDISSRIRGYASFLLCPRDLLLVCSWVLSYWWLVFTHTNLTDLTKYSFIAGFFFHANLANLTDGASLRPRLSASPSVCAPDGTREWNDACFVRFVRSVWDKFIGPGFRVFREIRVS